MPGLASGLHTAHRLWGRKPWAEVVAPAIDLARRGFTVLPKTSDLFAERLDKLRGGDADIRRLYLPGDRVPVPGSRLPNEDLARTMEILARHGADGFYRGPVAEAIVAASTAGGGMIRLEDLAGYRARVTTPIGITFRGYTLQCAPPPATGERSRSACSRCSKRRQSPRRFVRPKTSITSAASGARSVR